ncbi:radical SAM protein [Clostridium lundense]|uniref:radical SAM protein n=1 Tax=Clostridium lundense TaxID=319475 RepID=UPI0005580498
MLSKCKLCPRSCGVDRLNGELGFCKSGKSIKVARASLHYWEEPCISGTNGSGTVFFSNCNLSCVFCQNHQISQEDIGKEVSIERLSEIFLEQQKRGAHNINLVTPSHYVPQIIGALKIAKDNGLTLPIVYNTNSYENIDTIRLLEGYVDIYLPDLKYYNNKYAEKYSGARNYFKYASDAIKEMVCQVGPCKFDSNGMMKKGVIIRHMMLPGLLFDSKKVVDYIYTTFGNTVYVSIMNQYTPLNKATNFPEINKPVNPKHYEAFIDYCLSIGIKNGFIQEDGTVKESFIPKFNLNGI